MRKVLLAGLVFMAAVFSTHGIGLYFDGGIGVGPAWTTFDGKDFIDILPMESGKPKEIAVDFGVKLGLGPFDTIPIYVVGVFDGMGHRFYDDYDDYFYYSAYLFGPGVIFYPMPSLQVAASVGYSFVANESSISNLNSQFRGYLQESKSGFAWDISVAFDLGVRNHALLGGIKYFGATNTLELTGLAQNNSMISLFLRYAFRHKK
jgi:hypothetical protein